MSKIAMIGTFSSQAGKADEMATVLAAQVEAASTLDGVEVYSYHRGEGEAFSFFAVFTSMEALMAHGQAESLKAHMPAFMALMDGGPQMSTYSFVAAHGLDI